MATCEIRVGYQDDQKVLSHIRQGTFMAYLTNETNVYGRILFTLRDYLINYSKKFDKLHLNINLEHSVVYPNGTAVGLMGKINESRVDIGIQPFIMNEKTTQVVDFSYPYNLYYSTFMTRKPKYTPHMFGILQTFTLSMWIAVISVFIMMPFLYYVTLKKKHSLNKIFLHIFAVLLRQSSILKSSSVVEKLLVYSWVVGAMFLCLAYESVFFSFLAIPFVSQIRDVPQLARAVESGEYYCIANPQSNIHVQLLRSQQKNLRIIGEDVQKKNLKNVKDVYDNLFRKTNERNIAFLADTETIDRLAVGEDFVSDDRFLETMAAMMVRKEFLHKNVLDSFIHKMMASGLYFKYCNDRAFLFQLPHLINSSEPDTNKRKLTLTDVAPAFIFLLTGYFISFLVLIGEILDKQIKNRNYMKKRNTKNTKKKKFERNKIHNEDFL